MTDIFKYVRNSAIVAGVFLTSLTEATAQSVRFRAANFDHAIKTWKQEYKNVPLSVQKDSLYRVVNRVFHNEDPEKRADAYVGISDVLNLHWPEAYAQYASSIRHAKRHGYRRRVSNLWNQVDKAENDSARADYWQRYNVAIPNYLDFIKAPYIQPVAVGVLAQPDIKFPDAKPNIKPKPTQKELRVAANEKRKQDKAYAQAQAHAERLAQKSSKKLAKKLGDKAATKIVNFTDGDVLYDVTHIKKKRKGKWVTETVHLLNKDYLYGLVRETVVPRFVITEADKARYYAMTMGKINQESGCNATAFNGKMTHGTYGLTQIDQGPTLKALNKYIQRAGYRDVHYPRRGEKITESKLRAMLFFNAAYDDMRAKELAAFERKRKKAGLKPLLGQTVLVKAGKTYMPVTLNTMSVLAAMQAGPLILNHFAKMMDDQSNEEVVVFKKPFDPHDYNKKVYRKKNEGQDFNIFLTFAPQDLRDKAKHKELAQKAAAQGYDVAYTAYVGSSSSRLIAAHEYFGAEQAQQKNIASAESQSIPVSTSAAAPVATQTATAVATEMPRVSYTSDHNASTDKVRVVAYRYTASISMTQSKPRVAKDAPKEPPKDPLNNSTPDGATDPVQDAVRQQSEPTVTTVMADNGRTIVRYVIKQATEKASTHKRDEADRRRYDYGITVADALNQSVSSSGAHIAYKLI